MAGDPRLQRMYALAFLLSGTRERAIAIGRHAVSLRPEFDRLSAVELDRLIVLSSREQGPSHEQAESTPGAQTGAPSGHGAVRLFDAAMRLRSSAREAWMLREVIELDDTHAARAMDCSKIALNRFVEIAQHELGEHLTLDALAGLRRLADQVGQSESAAMLGASLGRDRRREQRSHQLLFTLCGLVLLWVTVEYACWQAVG